VGLRYRTIRAAASALLVAAAVGTGGMVGMTSVLAADPPVIGLAGTVVNHDGGAPLAGLPLVVTEIGGLDGGAVAAQTTTGADGRFKVDIEALGTADTPAMLTIRTPPDTLIQVIGDTCSQTWQVAIDPDQDVALGATTPDPLTITASTTLMGEVCGTTGVPSTTHTGGGGSAALTPPPTNTFVAPTSAGPDRLGPALTVGIVVGLLAAAALLLPRPGSRRRD
jgi:hypothetical protein